MTEEKKNKIRLIAFYLPQFHPIPENDKWWGKGFTEWRPVVQAKRLFPGHQQPHIPADLGFYDLRLSDVREEQAKMAKEAGIEGFCYWHYWFGNGKQLLERPLKEVVELGKPDFPFCIGWANHSWEKKLWDKDGTKEILIEQTYPGKEDYLAHFNSLLPAFRDERYIKVNNKLFFLFWGPMHNPDTEEFLKYWRKLAKENGLNDFYFVARDVKSKDKQKLLDMGFDAIYNDDVLGIHSKAPFLKRGISWLLRNIFAIPTIYYYKNAIKYMIDDDCRNIGVIPCIAPNWDHSPRSGGKAIIFHKSNPKLFGKLLKKAIETVKEKPGEERIIIIKSWNEWGEGNYLEPDLKFGRGYLEVIKDIMYGEEK